MSESSHVDLVLAVLKGDVEAVSDQIARGTPVNGKDSNGFTALMIAALHGKQSIVSLLLSRGAGFDGQSRTGSTALIAAVSQGHAAIVDALITIGANINLADGNRWTALMIAARRGDTKIVQALLEAKADVDALNIDRSSAILYAIEEGHAECVRLLLAYEPSLDEPNVLGSTALVLAADRGFVEIASLLLDAGANVNLPSSVNCMTPLHCAAQNGFKDMTVLLLARGADPAVKNKDGTTPMMYALWRGHHEIARILAQRLASGAAMTHEEQDAAVIEQAAEDMAAAIWRAAGATELSALEATVKVDSRNAKLWHNIGLRRSKVGRTADAVEAYDRALTLDASLWQTWNNKGEELRLLGHYHEALACYDKALEINPEDHLSWYNRGVVLNLTMDSFEKYEEARRCFEQARRLGHPRAAHLLEGMEKSMRNAVESFGPAARVEPSYRLSNGSPRSRHAPCPRCHAAIASTEFVCGSCGHVEAAQLVGLLVFLTVLIGLCFATWAHWGALIPWAPLAFVVRWGAAILGGVLALGMIGGVAEVLKSHSRASAKR